MKSAKNTNWSLRSASPAIASALLFGASTPAAKLLIGQIPAQMLAGILYLGSGLGLVIYGLITHVTCSFSTYNRLKGIDFAWLAGAVLFGGIAGPCLLMLGLSNTSAGSASLLLNLEAVFTALLAWFAFKENFDRRILLGMLAIVAASTLLVWQPGAAIATSAGSLAIVGACLCWALDNNLTRNISEANPVLIAAIKGLAAGLVNCVIALANGNQLPKTSILCQAAVLGFFGYGLSLVLFIKALRQLGTARTGAYFSTAPFAGAILSLLILHEPLTPKLLIAGLLMALGVCLHLTETHEHEHTHPDEEHEHMHSHDEHHQHEHDSSCPPDEPHSHYHKHVAITHSHPHFPDQQHRHEHE